MPEPNQPVDQYCVFRPDPLNSSSKIKCQLPPTPVGTGTLGAAVEEEPEEPAVDGVELAGFGFVTLTTGGRAPMRLTTMRSVGRPWTRVSSIVSTRP
jgi:hypothetical protein